MKFSPFIKLSVIVLIVTNLSGLFQNNQVNKNIYSTNTSGKYKKTVEKSKVDILNVGNPYITNYSLNTEEQIWSITQDKEEIMVFAHRKGILLFDGLNWQEISTNSIPLKTKFLFYNDVILIGGNKDYGFIKKDNTGKYKYHSLRAKKIYPGEISDIKVNNEYIFFYSANALIQLRKSDFSHKNSWHAKDSNKFKGIIQVGNKIFVNKNKGLFELKSKGKLQLVNKNKEITGKKIIFDIYYRKNRTLIGTEDNKLFLFDGKKFTLYKTTAQKYIEESSLTGAINISYNAFSLTTLSGGAIIINKDEGKQIQTINYNTGLPDDEIFAIHKDKQGSLWISHGEGISRINYNIPIKDFNSYPGLEGNLISLEQFNNTLYIATTQGLFYLDTVHNIKEIEKYIKKKVNTISQSNKSLSSFKRWLLKRKKKKEKKSNKKNYKSKKSKIKYIKQKTYKQSLSYIFKKVKFLNKKCKQIVKNKNSLIVATNKGIYEVKKNKAKKILSKSYINQIYKSSVAGVFYALTNNGLISFKKKKKKWIFNKKSQPKLLKTSIYSLVEDKNLDLWIGGNNIIYKYTVDSNQKITSFKEYELDNEFPDKISVKKIENKIYFIASNRIFRFDSKLDKIKLDNYLLKDSTIFSNCILEQNNISWFKNNSKWEYFSSKYGVEPHQISLLNLFSKIQNIKFDKNRSLWIIDGNNKLYKILPEKKNISFMKDFRVYFKEIHDETGNLLSLNNASLEYEHSSLTFKINAPFYLKKGGIKYQYYVKGVMRGWTEWRDSPELEFLVGNPGVYKLNIRAKNIFGNISPSSEVVFKIKSPLWMKTWFIISAIVFVIFISVIFVILIIKKRERRLRKEKKRLEEKVHERTIEISQQKEEIELQNIEITDSINYARQIQKAVIPPLNILKNSVREHFLINKPKNIVSGDYYWVYRENDFLIVAVADCTGHGVPGALLSMLGVSFLKEIVNNTAYYKANHILEELRYKVITALHQSGVEVERKDGMDIALSVFDLETMKVQFAGAYNPLYLIRKKELTIFKADRMPIGIHAKSDKAFTNNELDFKEGDTFYMFSDGYIDQFGGKNNRKFLTSNFQSLLLQIQEFDLKTQKNFLITTFENWKGETEQLDDVLIVGLRF